MARGGGRLVLRMTALALAAQAALAPAQTTGPQLATFHSEIDDSDQPYALYVPKSLAPGTRYPLVIGLHDEDSNHRLNMRQFSVRSPGTGKPTTNMRYLTAVGDVDFMVAARLRAAPWDTRESPRRTCTM